MRIAYVLTSLGVGGAERQAVALAERMAARGHAVSLIVLRGRQPHEWPTALDLVHLDMRKNPASFMAGLAKARGFLRGFKPDLIHSHTYPANIASRLLRISFPAASVLSTVHSVYEGPWTRMLVYRLTDSFSRLTTTVSEAGASRYVRLKAVSAHKCSVVTNGIDVAEFAPCPERRARLRAQMGVEAEFVWLAVGRIAPAKDYPNLLRAFSRVHAVIPAARLWVAGEAPVTGLALIQALAAELGIEASVCWLGLRRDIPALLDAADAFVSSSAWEGMPLAVIEAMSMEKPVVATDVGGVRELVGEAGIMVSARDPDALAQAMLALMRDALQLCGKMSHMARERIKNQFSFDAKANEWELLYRTMLEHRR
jgi:glycosyltransferase involved in cell wall biosynthesis